MVNILAPELYDLTIIAQTYSPNKFFVVVVCFGTSWYRLASSPSIVSEAW